MIDRGRVFADGTADELKASIGGSSLQLTPARHTQWAISGVIANKAVAVQGYSMLVMFPLTVASSGVPPEGDGCRAGCGRSSLSTRSRI